MADNIIKLRIESEANTKGFDETSRKLREQEREVGKVTDANKKLADSNKKVAESARGLGEAFKIGLGFAGGNAIINSLQAIPAAFKQAVTDGLHFNAVLESSKLGIAAVIKPLSCSRERHSSPQHLSRNSSWACRA